MVIFDNENNYLGWKFPANCASNSEIRKVFSSDYFPDLSEMVGEEDDHVHRVIDEAIDGGSSSDEDSPLRNDKPQAKKPRTDTKLKVIKN